MNDHELLAFAIGLITGAGITTIWLVVWAYRAMRPHD